MASSRPRTNALCASPSFFWPFFLFSTVPSPVSQTDQKHHTFFRSKATPLLRRSFLFFSPCVGKRDPRTVPRALGTQGVQALARVGRIIVRTGRSPLIGMQSLFFLSLKCAHRGHWALRSAQPYKENIGKETQEKAYGKRRHCAPSRGRLGWVIAWAQSRRQEWIARKKDGHS